MLPKGVSENIGKWRMAWNALRSNRYFRIALKITKRTLLFFFGLFLLLSILLQIPSIQNRLIDKASQFLSNNAGSEITVGHVKIGFFDRLIVEDFYAESLHGDTLIYSEKIIANLNTNLYFVLFKGLEFNKLEIKNTEVNLDRLEGDDINSLADLLSKIFPPKEKKEKNNNFRFNIEEIELDDVRFKEYDVVKGSKLVATVKEGVFLVNEINIPDKIIDIKSVDIYQMHMGIDKFERLGEQHLIPDTVEAKLEPGFFFLIEDFDVRASSFSLHNRRKAPVKITEDDVLDYDHLEVSDIQIAFNCLTFDEFLDFEGEVEKLAFREQSGFVLEELSSNAAAVNSQRLELNGLKILTPYSEIGDTLTMRYREYKDFESFEERVRMQGIFQNANVAIKDIITFSPGLKKNTFFGANASKVLRFDGTVSGRVNNLRGRDLNIELADGTVFQGGFSSRNLAVKNEQFLNLRVENLITSIATLRQLIPDFNPPRNFDKLGALEFKGSYDGFFTDFVAFGALETELGAVKMDMRMDLVNGKEQAKYSGNIDLIDFQVGTWLGNPKFGKVNFASKISDGFGLTGETADVKLGANIQNFQYNDYTYENAVIEGELVKNFFDGDLKISDNNINLDFNGKLDFRDSIPKFDFDAAIKRLDLQQLNFTKTNYILAGKTYLKLSSSNNRLSDIEGTALLNEFIILENNENQYEVDYMSAEAKIDARGEKHFSLKSDLIDANIDGQFDLEQIIPSLKDYLWRNHPGFYTGLRLDSLNKSVGDYAFSYNFHVKDSRELNNLIDPKLGLLNDIKLEGYFNNSRDSIIVDLDIPRIRYDNMEWVDIVLLVDILGSQGDLDFAVDTTILGPKTVLPTISLLSTLKSDTLDLGLHYSSKRLSRIPNLNIDGSLFPLDSTHFKIQFEPSSIAILEDTWLIDKNNYITFGGREFNTENFFLKDDEREIKLESILQKGLRLSLQNFGFSYIDELWDFDKMDFDGRFAASVEITDVFQMKGISASIKSDTFYVNNEDWGALRLDAEAKDLKSELFTFLSITKDSAQLLFEGPLNLSDLPLADSDKSALSFEKGYFDYDLDITKFPLAIGEYFIGNSVSEMDGTFNTSLNFSGFIEEPNIEGQIAIENGRFKIDYLNTVYRIDHSNVIVDNYNFDFSPTRLKDKFGNYATLHGGLRHDHLRDFQIHASMRTDRFLAIDTDKDQSDSFYGQAVGNGDITFTGNFDQPNIYINASVGDSTKIVIPVSSTKSASELKFITFVDKKEEERKKLEELSNQLTGIHLEMDLSVGKEAEMEIVFDEQAGDIIKGNGSGNISLIVPRTGDFQMFGDYFIEQGDYLFTLYNVVNKKFAIKNGGSIHWSGDPFGAEIKLEAEYSDLSASVANLIQEYLINASGDIQSEASDATDVNLSMQLEGELLRPIINFELEFPQLSGQLQTYTDSKLRLLRQDPNELNRQVFGLIVMGQFLPSGFDFQDSGSDIIYNTLSEFVSNQLSLLITELFSEFIGDGRVLSGIDFDIAYNPSQKVNIQGQNISAGEALEVRLKQDFFNDRLSIVVGGNIDLGGNLQATTDASGAFVGNDLVIEYDVSKDRSLKLKIYQRLRPDIGGGRKLQVGTGISFRKEFSSFKEFMQSLKKNSKKNKKAGT